MRGKLLAMTLGLALIVNACGDDDEEGKPAAQGGRAGGGAAGSAGTSQRGGNNTGTSGANVGGSDDGGGSPSETVAGAAGNGEPSAGGEGGGATAEGGAGPGAGGAGPSASCDVGGPVGTPAPNCEPADASDSCALCIEASCCDALKDCYATQPHNVCGYGGPATWVALGGEFACTHDCINDASEPGEVSLDVVQGCLQSCATPICTLPGDATTALTSCVYEECDSVCFH